MRSMNKIDREFLVDLLCTATYGCNWCCVKTLKSESELDNKYDTEYLDNRCLEEKWADRLLDGGHIVCYDYEDQCDDAPNRYIINLKDIIKGLKKARDGKAIRDWADFMDESEDYFTCNNLLQVIMFGEVIYG